MPSPFRRSATLLALLTAACAAATSTPVAAPARPPGIATARAYANGRWFDGERYVPRDTVFTESGLFAERRPARVDTVIDLHGGYVTPPFADAHTHNLDGTFGIDAIRDAYVREGTYYVQVLTNTRRGADAVKARWNRPCDLDVRYANGGLTNTLAHPFDAYEPRAMGIYDYAQYAPRTAEIRQSRLLLGDAYWFLDSVPDVAAQWPRILAGHPDVIKVYLMDATETPPPVEATGFGLTSGTGLRPSVLREILRRARAAGLPVFAHVETAADARLAMEAGVTGLAHLPGAIVASSADSAARVVTDDDARRWARADLLVIPTVNLVAYLGGPDSIAGRARTVAVQRANLARLTREGVRLLVGSDWYGRTAWREVAALRALGLWSNAELVRMWAVATPRALYPGRRIGQLAPGYEASFVVTAGDPLADLDALQKISIGVKQGCVMRTSAGQ